MLTGYFLILIFLGLLGGFYIIKPTFITRDFFLICSYLIIVLLAALRAPTFVADDMGYLQIFWGRGFCYFEWGFCQLNALIKQVGMDSYIYFGILACLVFGPVWMFIRKYSSNVVLSVLTYICLMYAFNSVNGIRQFLALSVVFLAFPLIQKRYFFQYLLAILIACSFHKSALICLSFYWLYITKVDFKNIFFIIIGCLAFCFLFNQFSSLYVALSGNYANYIVGEVQQGRLSTIIRATVNFFVACYCLLFYDKNYLYPQSKTKTLPFNFLTICACVSAAGALVALRAYMAERIVYYFYVFNILTIPNILRSISNKRLRVFMALVISLCLILYGAVVLWSWQQKGIIYRFFWQ